MREFLQTSTIRDAEKLVLVTESFIGGESKDRDVEVLPRSLTDGKCSAETQKRIATTLHQN